MSYNLVQEDGSLKNIAGGSGGDIGIEVTEAEYEELKEQGKLLSDTNYYITDAESSGGSSLKVEDISSQITFTPSSYFRVRNFKAIKYGQLLLLSGSALGLKTYSGEGEATANAIVFSNGLNIMSNDASIGMNALAQITNFEIIGNKLLMGKCEDTSYAYTFSFTLLVE